MPGGRRLFWTESGDPAGRPVLTMHGSPGGRLAQYPYPEQLVAAGIRQLTYDRPGYGRSDPVPGRTVADVVPDVEAVLDAADVDRVGVLGGSGGGPHALALATLLPQRCTTVHCIVGVAPYGAAGLDFFEGMDPENVRRFRTALEGRDTAVAAMTAEIAELAARAKGDPVAMMGKMKLPDVDVELLRRAGVQAMAALKDAVRQGGVGMADDFIAIASDWGFDPREATAPVVIEYGSHDVNVPAGHGRWLAANVPNVDVRVNSDGGHMMSPEAALVRLTEVSSA